MLAAWEALATTRAEREKLLAHWPLGGGARPDQRPPDDAFWRTWLILGGRGAGKTRTGAEWVRGIALGQPGFLEPGAGRIALIGETHADVRDVMVEGPAGIREVDPAVPIVTVHATRGKYLRAEPVALLYEQGRVRHVGAFPELEDEMADFGAGGLSSGRSPDRLDALVWALAHLMLAKAEPRLRRL